MSIPHQTILKILLKILRHSFQNKKKDRKIMLDESLETIEGKARSLPMRLLNERHYLEELAKGNRNGFMIEKVVGLAGVIGLGGLALIGAPAVAGFVGAIGLVSYLTTCVKESQHTGDFRPLPNRHNATGVAAGFVRGADKIEQDNSIEDDTLYLDDKEYGRWILLHTSMPQTVQLLSQFTEIEQETVLTELGNQAYRQYGRTFRSDPRSRSVAASQSCGVHILNAYMRDRHIEGAAFPTVPMSHETPVITRAAETHTVIDVQSSVVPHQVVATSESPEFYDVAQDLGDNPQSAIIAGVPGSGKGMLVSNAIRCLKVKHPALTVMMIDPKADDKEAGYWSSVADVVRRFKLMSCSDPDEGAAWLLRSLDEFNRLPSPKLLILDELLAVATELGLADKSLKAPQRLKKLLSGWVAQGDSQDVWVWAMTQSVNAADLGFSAGVRGNLRAIGIISPKNINAIEGLTSTRLIPPPYGGMDELRQLMKASPVARAFFDSKQAKWHPMPRLENHSGYDRDARSFISGSRPEVDSPEVSFNREPEHKVNVTRKSRILVPTRVGATGNAPLFESLIQPLDDGEFDDGEFAIRAEVIRFIAANPEGSKPRDLSARARKPVKGLSTDDVKFILELMELEKEIYSVEGVYFSNRN
jgi:hypothetical protein